MISVGVRVVDPTVSVWESMMGIGISIVGIHAMSGIWKSSVGKRMSIGGDRGLNYGGACKDSRISISLTLLPLCLNSLGLSLNRLGDNIGMISVGVRVSVSVWESMVVCIGNSWGLNLNSLDSRLDNRCGIDIGVVDIGAMDSIGQIVWISLSLSIGLSLLPFSSLHSGSLSLSGSSGSSGEWESMSPQTKVRSMKIRMTVGDNGSCSLNLSWLYFNRLDNRYVGDSMVSSKSI